ncbi:hypothetical protein SDJN03_09586, partial [Cucurbita argyrosperma subsp. sororia]
MSAYTDSGKYEPPQQNRTNSVETKREKEQRAETQFCRSHKRERELKVKDNGIGKGECEEKRKKYKEEREKGAEKEAKEEGERASSGCSTEAQPQQH